MAYFSEQMAIPSLNLPRLCLTALLCALPWFAVAESSSEVSVQLSSFSSDNQNPFAATTPDGRIGFVAWDGLDAQGNRRIFLREHRDGVWLAETTIDTNREGDNRSPVMGVDALGNLHIAWLARQAGNVRVQLRSRLAGEWLDWGVVDAGKSGENSSSVALRLDGEGRPWVAWESAGSGNRYNIRCAWLSPSGIIDDTDLTSDSLNYNILPEILFLSEPTVVWYTAQDNTFSLAGRSWNASTGDWKEYEPGPEATALPADRMPLLFSSPTGRLSAVWRDAESSEAEDAESPYSLERVLFQELAPSPNNPLALTAEFGISTVAGSSGTDLDLLAWSAEAGNQGRQVFVSTREANGEFEVPAPISDGKGRYYGSPSLAAFSHGGLAAWTSSAAEGGNGHIYAARIRVVSQ